MPTANERQALWFLAIVALCGGAVRLARARLTDAPVAAQPPLVGQIRRVDSARTARGKRASARQPTVPGATVTAGSPEPNGAVDLDRAGSTELERLPGIGPTLAKRIVANRDSLGPFGVLEALCDVRGVGPALIERLRPLISFSGVRRSVSAQCGVASKKPGSSRASRRAKPR